jgi:hypothetical protein
VDSPDPAGVFPHQAREGAIQGMSGSPRRRQTLRNYPVFPFSPNRATLEELVGGLQEWAKAHFFIDRPHE